MTKVREVVQRELDRIVRGDENGAVKSSKQNPWTPEYWRIGSLKPGEAKLTHRIKTLYGFSVLMRLVPDAAQRLQARESLRFLMA